MTVFVCPYAVGTPNNLKQPLSSTVVSKEFIDVLRLGQWPYDLGDDPAFYCSKRFAPEGAALTWGVCRRNVRNRVLPGDTIAFFGFEPDEGTVTYRFSGFATVAEKVSQPDLWQRDDLAVYRRFLNLLIAPDGDGFAHREVAPGNPHADWLWRMTASRGATWTAADFSAYRDPNCTARFRPGIDVAGNGQPVRLAANYIIFSRDPAETFIVQEPPVIATSASRSENWRERWAETDLAKGIHELTVGTRPGRGLRTAQRGYSHVAMQLQRNAVSWRGDMLDLLRITGMLGTTVVQAAP